jgi:hypothetical protein
MQFRSQLFLRAMPFLKVVAMGVVLAVLFFLAMQGQPSNYSPASRPFALLRPILAMVIRTEQARPRPRKSYRKVVKAVLLGYAFVACCGGLVRYGWVARELPKK